MKGRTLLHYELLDKLGEGGMGAVWQARDTRLNRIVAIKTLPADKVADPQRKRRFVQEAQAASALNHPNIVTIYVCAPYRSRRELGAFSPPMPWGTNVSRNAP